MKFDGRVPSTTVTQIKHTKENQIRTIWNDLFVDWGSKSVKTEKGKGAKGQRGPFCWLMRLGADPLAKLSVRLDQWFMSKQCSTT